MTDLYAVSPIFIDQLRRENSLGDAEVIQMEPGRCLSARALAFGQALLRGLGGNAASITIAVATSLYFAWQFTR